MDAQSTVNTCWQGQLLVATPFIKSQPYRQTVVLLMRHTDRGSVGLLLDNRLPVGLAERGQPQRFGEGAERQAADADSEIRLVRGCVIWPPGQLEREMAEGIWLITPAQVNMQTMADDLWAGLLRQIGRSVLQDTLGIRRFPINPHLN